MGAPGACSASARVVTPCCSGATVPERLSVSPYMTQLGGGSAGMHPGPTPQRSVPPPRRHLCSPGTPRPRHAEEKCPEMHFRSFWKPVF